MINKYIDNFMSTSPSSLKDFSDFINKLIKEHGRETIITTAGIDKNVLYRASHSQNITLDNYYKIKKAYNNQLTSTLQSEYIEQLPILGQIIDNIKVRILNPSQPNFVPVPADLVKAWSPVLGYLCVSGTAYSGFVLIFSGKGLDDVTSKINNACINRIVMIYPENEDPMYGMILKQDNNFVLIHAKTRKVLYTIPKLNSISWAKFICMIPYSLMEDHKEPESDNNKYHNNLHKLDNTFINKLNK
jgi:hypothetical protein